MSEPDPALIDLDGTRQAHDRMYSSLSQTSVTSPEARALRSVLVRVSESLTTRTHRAPDSDMAAREIQFLTDLRDAAEFMLSCSIPYARKHSDVTWQQVGDLLGISRQAAWERYGKQQ